MADLNNLNLRNKPRTIGAIPISYKVSMTVEEQLLYIGAKIDEIINFIDTILEQKINDYIDEKFNDIMINSMYDAETETLILYLDNSN